LILSDPNVSARPREAAETAACFILVRLLYNAQRR
jgi:hypothetical protein